jgi:hypothetical protein
MASVGLHTRVDYIDGDPAEPGPINDGTLELDSDGLHFSCHGKEELHAGLEDLRGITVSGSGGHRHKVRRHHHTGTTRLAISRDQRPMVWEFALDRTKGMLLRERINRELAGAGRPPLPYVEALYDFEPAVDAVFAEQPPAPLRTEHADRRDRRGFIFALVALMVLLEIGVPLLILFVF